MARKAKPIPMPEEVWVMSFRTYNVLGSIAHVTSGEKFFRSEEACQKEIDGMKGWIGMGDREQYRPLRLVRGEE
jgi:hypothetical protein